jgi:hypothetical protein
LRARDLEIHCFDWIRGLLVIVFRQAGVFSGVGRDVLSSETSHVSPLAYLGPAFPGTHTLLKC